MAIPDFQTLMLPFLEMASDKIEHSSNDFREPLAIKYNLTEEEKAAMLASGSQRIFHNRVHWAKAYLKMSGLIESTRRGFFKISDRGLKILEEKPERITIKYLRRFPDFQAAREPKKDSLTPENVTEDPAEEVVTKTPHNPHLADRWSLGILLYSMLNGCCPFKGANQK